MNTPTHRGMWPDQIGVVVILNEKILFLKDRFQNREMGMDVAGGKWRSWG